MTRDTTNVDFYDADSASYDQRWEGDAGVQTNRAQHLIVQTLCVEWNGRRVVEIGPGTARFSITLADKCNRLTLVDISARMLTEARRNLEAAGFGDQVEDYVHGSAYELPFADGSFDHAMALNVFNHLAQPGAALKEMARVVRPGATLLFNYANLHSYFWPVARRINQRQRARRQDVFSIWEVPEAVEAMIEDAGLQLIRRVGNVHVPRSIYSYRLHKIFELLDRVSRTGPLSRLAPIHYCLCRKRRDAITTR